MEPLKKLEQIFNIEPLAEIPREVIEAQKVDSNLEDKDSDYELARKTLRSLIEKNDSVLESIVSLAKNSETARHFEVAGQLMKTQSDMAKDLMNIHKQKKDIEGPEAPSSIKQQNNIVFTGSTSDLMKMISAEKARTIDSKD